MQVQVLQQEWTSSFPKGWVAPAFLCQLSRRLEDIWSKCCFSPKTFAVICPWQELCQDIILQCQEKLHWKGLDPQSLQELVPSLLVVGHLLRAPDRVSHHVPALTPSTEQFCSKQWSFRNQAFKYSRIDLKTPIHSFFNTSSWIFILCF